MNGGSILKQTLSTGVVDIWGIESIELGGTNEIGVVRMSSLTRKNTIDGVPTAIVVPANMISAMHQAGLLEVFNKEN